METSHSAPREV